MSRRLLQGGGNRLLQGGAQRLLQGAGVALAPTADDLPPLYLKPSPKAAERQDASAGLPPFVLSLRLGRPRVTAENPPAEIPIVRVSLAPWHIRLSGPEPALVCEAEITVGVMLCAGWVAWQAELAIRRRVEDELLIAGLHPADFT